MNNWSDIFAPLIGRILMGGFFLWSGIEASLNFDSTVVTLTKAGVPSPVVCAILTVAIEVLCGIALVVGYACRISAITLAVFVFASAFLNTSLSNELTQTLYLQNMAIIGGLLYISAYGEGPWRAVPEPAKPAKRKK